MLSVLLLRSFKMLVTSALVSRATRASFPTGDGMACTKVKTAERATRAMREMNIVKSTGGAGSERTVKAEVERLYY